MLTRVALRCLPALLGVLLAATLAACGSKGDLMLPRAAVARPVAPEATGSARPKPTAPPATPAAPAAPSAATQPEIPSVSPPPISPTKP